MANKSRISAVSISRDQIALEHSIGTVNTHRRCEGRICIALGSAECPALADGVFSSVSFPPGVLLRLRFGTRALRSRTHERGAAADAGGGGGRPRPAAVRPAAHCLRRLGHVREAGVLPQTNVRQIEHTRRVLQLECLPATNKIVLVLVYSVILIL